jgi:hypothetical protein
MIITTSTEKEEEEKEVGNYTIVPLHRSRPQKYLCRSSDVNYQQKKGPEILRKRPSLIPSTKSSQSKQKET